MGKPKMATQKLTCEETGRLGGIASVKARTPEQIKAWAKKAARKRWGPKRKRRAA
jgi:hypothetical protein